MFDFIRNIALPEFWAFWGVPFAVVVVAGLAMAFSIWLAPTVRWRWIGMEVAAFAIASGFIYGWGGSNRDKLCAAQVAAYEAEFVKMQDKLNAATAAHAVELEGKIKTVEQDHEEKLVKIRARLAESETGSCMPSDEFLDGVRTLRSKGSAAGKR